MCGHIDIRLRVIRIAAIGALIASTTGPATVVAQAHGPTASDAVSVFASAPAPGHPFGPRPGRP